MKQLKLVLIFSIAATLFILSCRKEINRSSAPQQVSEDLSIANYTPPGVTYCGSESFTMLAGQTINVGSISVGNDATNLYVTYNVLPGYLISETHLYVGTLALLPVTNSGNAIPGHFPYNTTHSPKVATFTYTIPLSSITNTSGCYVVAAHSVITNASGYPSFNQTSWIAGTRINDGGNWAMYNNWCTASCVEAPPEK